MQFMVFFYCQGTELGYFFKVARISNIFFWVLEIPDIVLG